MIEVNNVGSVTQIVNRETLEMVEIYFPNQYLKPNKSVVAYVIGNSWN